MTSAIITTCTPWMKQANCRGILTNIFFPEENEVLVGAAAKKVCRRCPVKEECLQWALDHDEVGIWGGTTDAQRDSIRRKRHRVRCPDCRSMDVVESDVHHEVCISCGMSWAI